MEDIKQRLEETSENCLKGFAGWCANKKDAAAREVLQNAIHELRKVASRLEIELAISERDEMAQKAIPIPPHRASRGKKGQSEFADDESIGNVPEQDPSAGGLRPKIQRRRPQNKKPS